MCVCACALCVGYIVKLKELSLTKCTDFFCQATSSSSLTKENCYGEMEGGGEEEWGRWLSNIFLFFVILFSSSKILDWIPLDSLSNFSLK